MPAAELEWKVYEVTEGVVGARDAIAPAEARVDVWIPDLSEYPEALDKAKILLETAAEVEHALLVQYLYAAFSLKGSAEGADDSQKNSLKKWLRELRQIAQQEMAHLMSVENLLLAIGLPPNLEREDFPPRKDLYPFELHLEALTQKSLAKYVTAEAPQDATGIDAIVEQAKDKEGAAINHVGTIYGLLGVLFSTEQQIETGGSGSESWDRLLRRVAKAADQQNPDRSKWHLGESTIDPQTLTFQAASEVWHGATVHQIGNRDAARAAIRQIGEQGEGPTSGGGLSHFERFLSMYRGGDGVLPFPSEGEWIPTRAVPRDQKTDAIAEPRTQRWAQLADLRYTLLLGFIEHHLLTSDAGDRKHLADWAFDEMDALRELSGILVALPLGNGCAALSFTMPKLLHLPATEQERWQLQRDRTNAAISHVQQMQAADPADPNADFLGGLRGTDKDRLLLMHGEAPPQSTSFARDILPLFRQKDIDHMNDQVGMDLTDFVTVRDSAVSISQRLKGVGGRRMPPPPDPPLPDDKIKLFDTWMAEGFPP